MWVCNMTVKACRNPTPPPITSTRLKYQQVKDYLLEQMADGHLKAGDVLPPERILAKQLGRAVHTVRHALDELRNEQVVRRVRGKGTLVNGRQPAATKQKLDVFALIVPEGDGSLYPSLIRGFIEAAATSHRQVLVCNTHLDMQVQSDIILQLLNKRNVGGVAIVPPVDPMPAYQLDMLRSHGIPAVFCHRRPPELRAPLITWSYEEVGRRAGETIVDLGHRCVVFTAGARYVVSEAYLRGFRGVLGQYGLDLPDSRVLFNPRLAISIADEGVHRELAEILDTSERPTAVFCSDTDQAEFVFYEAGRLGLRVPEDLSIIGFGCAYRKGVVSNRMATITVDEVDMGRRAVSLIGQMQAGEQPLDSAETVFMPMGFSEGHTLGVAPPSVLAVGKGA